jgi:hypothetical protein
VGHLAQNSDPVSTKQQQLAELAKGNVVFHARRSTAFPQSEPGKGTPGPVWDLAAEKLRGMLGLTSVSYVEGKTSLAVTDPTLE